MKSVLCAFSLTAAVLVLSSTSFASGGKTYAECSGKLQDGTAVDFQIRATAVPTFIDAVLVKTETNELLIQLSCVRGDDLIPGTPSAGQLEWVCSEYKHVDDGDLAVRLERSGVTGVITGSITRKQMYPLKPKKIGRLVCKN